MELFSIITCPSCNHKSIEEMSVTFCNIMHNCKKCKLILRPKKGHCCVYCSYGNIPCPSKQKAD